MVKKQEGFKVEMLPSEEYPFDVRPCITRPHGPESMDPHLYIICEFWGEEDGREADIICNALNAAHAANKDLQSIS